MAATVRVYQLTGSGTVTRTNVDEADGTDPRFGTDDAVQSTAPIVIPTTTGTRYSRAKVFCLRVTAGGGSTAISNRKIKLSTAPAAGSKLWFDPLGTTYAQGTIPADDSTTISGGADPGASYTALTTSYQTYDSSSEAATNNDDNGDYVAVVFGVDSTYAGGPGTLTLPVISFSYDEA